MIATLIKVFEGVKLLIPFIAEMIFGGTTLKHAIKSTAKQKMFFVFVIGSLIIAIYMSIRVFQLAADTIQLNTRIQLAEKTITVCENTAEEIEKLAAERDKLLDELRAMKKASLHSSRPSNDLKDKEKRTILRDETLNAVNSKLLEGH